MESNNRAQDLTAVIAMQSVRLSRRLLLLTTTSLNLQNPEVSVRIANDTECRTQFANDGVLSGTPPSNAVKMGKYVLYQSSLAQASVNVHFCSPYPVFSIARNLGNITETSSPIVWAVGGIRDPSVSYTTSTGKGQQRSPLYVTSYSDMSAVVRSTFPHLRNKADIFTLG